MGYSVINFLLAVVVVVVAVADRSRAAVPNVSSSALDVQRVQYVGCNESSPSTFTSFESNVVLILSGCTSNVFVRIYNEQVSWSVLSNVSIIVRDAIAMPKISIVVDEVHNLQIEVQNIIASVPTDYNDIMYPLLFVFAMQMENVSIHFTDVVISELRASSMIALEAQELGTHVTLRMVRCRVTSYTATSVLSSVGGGNSGLGKGTGKLEGWNVSVSDSVFIMMFPLVVNQFGSPFPQGFYRCDSGAAMFDFRFIIVNVTLDATMKGNIRCGVIFKTSNIDEVHNVVLVLDRLHVTARVSVTIASNGSILDGVAISIGTSAENISVTMTNSFIQFVGGRMSGVSLRTMNVANNVSVVLSNTTWVLNATFPTVQIQYPGATFTLAEPHGATIVDLNSLSLATNISVSCVDTISIIAVINPPSSLLPPFPLSSGSGYQNYSVAYARYLYIQDSNAQDISIYLQRTSLSVTLREGSECLISMLFGFSIVAVGFIQADNCVFTNLIVSLIGLRLDADITVQTPIVNNAAFFYPQSRRVVLVGVAMVQLTSTCTTCSLTIESSHCIVHQIQILIDPSHRPYRTDTIDSTLCSTMVVVNTTTFVDSTGVAAYVERCGGSLKNLFPPLSKVYTLTDVTMDIMDSTIDASPAFIAIDGVVTPMTVTVFSPPATVTGLVLRTRNVTCIPPPRSSDGGGDAARVFGAILMLSSTTVSGMNADLVDTVGFPSLVSMKLANGWIQQSNIRAKRMRFAPGRASVTTPSLASAAVFLDGEVATTSLAITLQSCEVDASIEYPSVVTRVMASPASTWSGSGSHLQLMGCTRWSTQRLTNRAAEKLMLGTPRVVGAIAPSLSLDGNACEGTETLEVVPVLRPSVPRTAMAATFAAMIGSAIGSTAGSAMRLETSMAVLRATRLCEAGDDSSSSEDDPGSALSDNPLQVSLQGVAGGLQLAAGAIIGNTMAMMLWTILLEFVVPCIKRVRSLDSLRGALHDFLAVLPGDGAAAVLLLLQPTVAASVALLSGPPQAAMILGVLGVMLYVLAMGLVVVWLLRDFPLVGVVLPYPRRGTVLSRLRGVHDDVAATADVAERWYLRTFWRRIRWRRNGNGTTAASSIRVRSLFNVYQCEYFWFFAVDLFVPMGMGVLVGLATAGGGTSACSWMPWTSVAILLVVLVVSAAYRPYATPWLNVTQVGIGNGLSVVVVFLTAVKSNAAIQNKAVEIQSYVSVASVVIDLIALFIDAMSSGLLNATSEVADSLNETSQSDTSMIAKKRSSGSRSTHSPLTSLNFLTPGSFKKSGGGTTSRHEALEQLVKAACFAALQKQRSSP